MTPDERDLLIRFLDDLRRIPSTPRDSEAAQMIDNALLGKPDALYLLVQHALLADQALYEAQRRIAALEERENARAPEAQNFLRPKASPWSGVPSQPPPREAPGREDSGFSGRAAPAQPGGFSSFLRNSAATAAGFAGGAFLFEGLSNLFGGHHAGSFLGGGLPPHLENARTGEPLLDTTPEHHAVTPELQDASYTDDSDDSDDAEYYDDDDDDSGDLGDSDSA